MKDQHPNTHATPQIDDSKEKFYLYAVVNGDNWPVDLMLNMTSDPQMRKHNFENFISEQCLMNSKSMYVPDFRIREYEMPNMLYFGEILEYLSSRKSLIELAEKHSGKLTEDIPLRAAYIFWDWNRGVTDENMLEKVKKAQDGDFEDIKTKTEFDQWIAGYDADLFLTAYHSKEGTLIVDNSTYGEKRQWAYETYLESKYFYPDKPFGDTIVKAHIKDPSDYQKAECNKTYLHFTTQGNEYSPVHALTNDEKLLGHKVFSNKIDISHDRESFSRFIEDLRIDISPANAIINELLFIKEMGYPSKHDSIHEELQNHFTDIANGYEYLRKFDRDNDIKLYELINVSQKRADSILRQYGIIGKPLELRSLQEKSSSLENARNGLQSKIRPVKGNRKKLE